MFNNVNAVSQRSVRGQTYRGPSERSGQGERSGAADGSGRI